MFSGPPLKALLVLESIVRHKSVTRAAVELCVTHSAISKQLALLEQYLGSRLFVRNRHGMAPTPEAECLARTVADAQDRISIALDDLFGKHCEVVLNILAPATFAMRWLIPRLPDFSARHANIRPQVRPTHTPDDWTAMPFDVVLRRGDEIPSRLTVAPLLTEHMGLVAAPLVAARLRERCGRPFHAGDLVAADTRPGELMAWLDAAGHDLDEADSAEKYPHNYIALEAALAGRGAMVAPLEVVSDLLEQGRLETVFPDITLPGKIYYAGYDPSSHRQASAQAFVAWLEGRARAKTQRRARSA